MARITLRLTRTGGDARVLTLKLDRVSSEPSLLADGKFILFHRR